MANTADNVQVGVKGKVYLAPLGTTVPTTATGAIDAAAVELGYVTVEGVTKSTSKNTTDILAWGGDLIRTVVTDATTTFKFALMESSEAVIEAYLGATMTGGAIDGIATATTKGVIIIDILDDPKQMRIVIANGEIIEVDDQVYAGGEAITYGVTVRAYADNGVNFKQYFSNLEV